jgi:hypothetical protein
MSRDEQLLERITLHCEVMVRKLFIKGTHLMIEYIPSA